MTVLLYISFLVYPFFSGWKDAVLWSKRGADAYKWDEHLIFIGERIGVAIPFILCFSAAWNHSITWSGFVTAGLCALASFFFVHNGMYYQGRYWIDNAYPGFWADTKNKKDKAPLNVSFPIRLALLACSTIYILCYEYYF